MKFTPITGEDSRTYHFPGGNQLTIPNVTGLYVRPSGSHRLETKSGGKYIVAAGWLAIEVVAPAWSV